MRYLVNFYAFVVTKKNGKDALKIEFKTQLQTNYSPLLMMPLSITEVINLYQ